MAFGAMVALARRAREGGSWLVRISLAQVGKWIVDLGEVPAAALEGIPAEFTAGELERWSTAKRDAVSAACATSSRRCSCPKPRRTGRGPRFRLVITPRVAVKAESRAICTNKGRKRQERSLPPSADFANVVALCCFASIHLHGPGAL